MAKTTSGSGGKPGHPIESLDKVVEWMRGELAKAEKKGKQS